MPKLNVSVPHKLTIEGAKEQTNTALSKLIKAFNGSDEVVNWAEDSANFQFKSLGFTIKGEALVKESEVETSVELPFAAIAYKGKATQAINKYLTEALHSE